mmetsp:Transcript_15846/g.61917  ORF Transcript_15846/g.61917 Transcript_15846/m.61917 type:complete len:383 (+) Transcript_15846:959-2107(+)
MCHVLLVGLEVALDPGVEVVQLQSVGDDEARDEVHDHQAHFEPFVRALEAAEQLLCKRLGVVQQLNGREIRVQVVVPFLRLRKSSLGTLELLLPLAGLLGARAHELLQGVGLLLVAVVVVLVLVLVLAHCLAREEELQRRHEDLRRLAQARRTDHVHRPRVVPDVATIELNHDIERVLGSDLAWVLEHVAQEVLEHGVELVVLALLVRLLDVLHNVRRQELAQLLVMHTEQLEEQRQQDGRGEEVAVAQHDKSLDKASAHVGVEGAGMLLKHLRELLREGRQVLGIAGSDVAEEADQLVEAFGVCSRVVLEDLQFAEEVSVLELELLIVRILVPLHEVLQLQKIRAGHLTLSIAQSSRSRGCAWIAVSESTSLERLSSETKR